MSDENKKKAAEYIGKTKLAVLATAGANGIPYVRTLASFANDGLKVYFSTNKRSAKVEQIQSNPQVTLLFQHEGQEIITFKNVSITGIAEKVCCGNELDSAVKLLGDKNLKFKERAEKNDLEDTLIFKVEPKLLKYLDFSRGIGPAAAEEEQL